MLPRRPLGSSGIEVSVLALGSWRTYERIQREDGLAVMRAAQESGINFLDDARYNDETGRAPLKSGYSEVVFGELFRAAGWKRDEVIVANKLWWEFWPEQSAAQELDGSLGRMGLDFVDLIYSDRPPDGHGMEQLVHDVGGLLRAGKARAWGTLNWTPALIVEAARVAATQGVPAGCAVQLPYSLAQPAIVEDPAMTEALRAADAVVVASYVLAGGALTGKYADPAASGRLAGQLDDPAVRRAVAVADELRALANRAGTTPSALAVAFALLNPSVASVLFGATSPHQVSENVRAVELLPSLAEATVAELRRIGQ